jgi:hypothetical protein
MLRYMRTHAPDSGVFLLKSFYPDYCAFSSCSRAEAVACVRHLESLGYIRYKNSDNVGVTGFYLEHKAYHAVYFYFKEKWQIYLIPAAVTVLTTALLRALGWS